MNENIGGFSAHVARSVRDELKRIKKFAPFEVARKCFMNGTQRKTLQFSSQEKL